MNTRRQRWLKQKSAVYSVDSAQSRDGHGRDDQVNGEKTRIDLAVEANAFFGGARPIDGVRVSDETVGSIRVSRMQIESVAAAKRLGKSVGHYTTLEVPELRRRDPDLQEQVAEVFAEELKSLLQLDERASVLIVGLGNWNVTPDSLGPLVIEKLLVTRHLFSLMPESMGDGFRSVSAFAPGVLGLTGIETGEIVSGVVDRIQPDLVIAIDALAARSIERVNATVQVADTGIQPGGGVGNHRMAINQETLGVKVLAVGVPTVVDAVTIASDAIDLLLRELEAEMPTDAANVVLQRMRSGDKRRLIAQVLEPLDNNLLVTPKEVDEFVDDMSYVLALALNAALHPGLSFAEAKELTRG